MEKSFVICLLLWSIILTGCNKQIISTAEQECINNSWNVTTDGSWNNICQFTEYEQCKISEMEAWVCDYLNHEWGWEWISVVTDLCEEEWWEVQHREEGWDDFEVCMFEDESFCYLNDLADWSCGKWDMKYYDEE